MVIGVWCDGAVVVIMLLSILLMRIMLYCSLWPAMHVQVWDWESAAARGELQVIEECGNLTKRSRDAASEMAKAEQMAATVSGLRGCGGGAGWWWCCCGDGDNGSVGGGARPGEERTIFFIVHCRLHIVPES